MKLMDVNVALPRRRPFRCSNGRGERGKLLHSLGLGPPMNPHVAFPQDSYYLLCNYLKRSIFSRQSD